MCPVSFGRVFITLRLCLRLGVCLSVAALGGCAQFATLNFAQNPHPRDLRENKSEIAAQSHSRSGTLKQDSIAQSGGMMLYSGTTGAAACNLPQAASYARIIFTPVQGSQDSDIVCTGSVLNERSILTAAHCGGMKTFSGNGVFSVSCGCDSQNVQGGTYQKIGNLDAAVITFAALPLNCKPVALGSTKEIVAQDQDVLIAGFGAQPGKEVGSFAFGTATVNRLGATEAPDHPLGQRLDMIVLRKEGFNEAGTCGGDSGAPYLFQVPGQFVQVGVHVGVLSNSLDSCPLLAEMMGHDTLTVMQFLTSSGIPFTRYPLLATASPKPSSGPFVTPGPSMSPAQSSAPTVSDQEKCTMSARTLAGKIDSVWRLFEADGRESACYNMCQINALSLLQSAPLVACSFGGREILTLSGRTASQQISACARENIGTAWFLRLRFATESAPCSAQIQRGICDGASSTPVFNGSFQQVACAKTSLEPGWQTSCLSLKEGELGALNWEIHPTALTREACLQACQSYKESLDPKDLAKSSLSCVFRSAAL